MSYIANNFQFLLAAGFLVPHTLFYLRLEDNIHCMQILFEFREYGYNLLLFMESFLVVT